MTNTALINNCVTCHHAAGDVIPLTDGGIYDASGGGVLVGNLDLANDGSAAVAYAALINVPAKGDAIPANAFEEAGSGIICDTLVDAATPGHFRVVPDDAGASLLCLKLKAGLPDAAPPPCGASMPLTGPLEEPDGASLQDTAFTDVAAWINEGANP